MKNYVLFLVFYLNAMDHLHLQIPPARPSLDTRSHAKFNIRNCFATNYKESLNVINEKLLSIYDALHSTLFHRAELLMMELLVELQKYQENISSFHSYIQSNHYEPFLLELGVELSTEISRLTKILQKRLCSLINECNRYIFPLEHHKFWEEKLERIHNLLRKSTILARDSFATLLSP